MRLHNLSAHSLKKTAVCYVGRCEHLYFCVRASVLVMLEGERVKGYVPEARWESLSIPSSLRIDGSTEAIVYEGRLDGEFFK